MKTYFYLLVVIGLLLPGGSAYASHLYGAELTYRFVGASSGTNHYQVTLVLHEDCQNGQLQAILEDNPAFIAVYEGTTLKSADSINYTSFVTVPVTFAGSCAGSASAPAACLKKTTFVKDYYLPASSIGYTVVYQRCCRSATITNITDPSDNGLTFFCVIPPSGVVANNTSAVFTNFPPFIITLNEPLVFDGSATDADADSLSYGLVAPLMGATSTNIKPFPPAPPPFDSVLFMPSFSSQHPLICSVPFTLNPATGLLTCTPSRIGRYLLTEICYEWRSGALINSIRRDIQFVVSGCALDVPVNSLAANEIKLYPDPNSGTFTVSGKTSESSLEACVINMYGQQVCTTTIECRKGYFSSHVVLDNRLPRGIYVLRLTGTNMNAVKTFVLR